MHDLLFEHQQAWSVVQPDQARELFIGYAEELGLDVEQFTTDLEQGTFQSQVLASYQEAAAIQLPGTPTFFINGQYFEAPLSYYYLDAFVRLGLLEQGSTRRPPR